MIRSSCHNLQDLNIGKQEALLSFLAEYRRVGQIILDEIWEQGYEWNYGEETKRFYVKENLLELPEFLDYNRFGVETLLSARAMSSLVTQISGILRGNLEKQRKRFFIRDQQLAEGKCVNRKLLEKIEKHAPGKPNISRMNAEISSKCCDFEKSDKFFEGFLRLKSIGSSFDKIILPIRFHKHSKQFSTWERKNSFLVGENFVNIRWFKETPAKKEMGSTLGADQGKTTCLTLSDSQITTKNSQGIALPEILEKLARKKKGSKAFRSAQVERKNYINWSINQLNFSGIKEIRLEDIWNISYGRRLPRKLVHWTNTIIRDKVEARCETEGVLLKFQTSTYRSQRCSCCGFVRKANRKGKTYLCVNCGLEIDADLNAALNHEQDLPDVPYSLRVLKLNRKGFFWKPEGFFDQGGVELGVPLVTSNQSISNV